MYASEHELDENIGHANPRAAAVDVPRRSGSNFQPAYIEDASTLFVSEHATPVPDAVTRAGSFMDTPLSNHPTAPPRPSGPPKSTFDKILNMQKKFQEKKAAASKRAASYQHRNANPDSETYLEAIISGQPRSTGARGPNVDEDEMANREASAEFQKQKRHYDELRRKNGGTLSFRHDVEWMKIKGAEDARRKKQKRDLAYAQEEGEGEPDLFPEVNIPMIDEREDESDDDLNFDEFGSGSRKRQRREMPRKEAKQVSMQDAELQSMRVALEADDDIPKKKKKGQSGNDTSQEATSSSGKGRIAKVKSTRPSKAKAPKKAAPKGVRKSAKDKRQVNHAMKQASSLLGANVFEQQAGPDAMEQPTFTSTRRKADALKELIASVPLGDKKAARGDMVGLLAATKDFNGRGSVKPHGNSGWMVKGMKTSLKPYQVMGTAFMRRRENDEQEPRGGLMADQMGLGKTLMMLANIVNGQPPKSERGPRTTLLVASNALLSQWAEEIMRHTNCNFKIMRYNAGTRIDSSVASKVLGAHDIVLTTYGEVMKSYPKNTPPIECQSAEQKIAWWKQVYEEQRGVLHSMMFYRIVLDEAQAIKNHTARTSIACRALMAQHKWALSGTPILNSLTELYPYFKFLGVPHTGSFKIFKHNYCDTKDAENAERLLVRLSQFMIRRTHADYMFNAPILKLPQATQTTYWCEFNSVERCIYDIVRQRFAKRLNMWAKKGELESSYSNALVMLLRLRQLTAHVLMLQFVMQDLLEREDIERIREVVNNQAADSNSRRGRTILAIRKQLDQLSASERKKGAKLAADKAAQKAAEAKGRATQNNTGNADTQSDEEEIQEDPEPEGEAEIDGLSQQKGGRGKSGEEFGKTFNFKPFLSSLKTGESWEKVKKKAKCYYCGKQPELPFVTSCGHLICGGLCLEQSMLEAAEDGREHAPCKACGVTPQYVHPCEPDEDDVPEPPSRGTRTAAAKKKEQQRVRRDREDIAEDWLGKLGEDVLPSAKTIAVKAQILNWIKENPGVKIIIYTQFLAMIRILAKVCEKEGWKIEQYHGKMSFGARDKAIAAFAKDADVRIMLASLRCGGLGLNLTMASKVIMIDPWWNSASEQQAFCRVFRIGQQDETFMSRLCVKDTVDQRLIEMQERKQKEIDNVMEDGGKRTDKMDIRDLMRLFGNLDNDSEGKPFIMVDNPDPRGGFRADRDDEGYADDF
ncbi:hypothetical protein P153DRAFT_340405 [Dothidotthia symphoricarpi CBS 119687]|uniref:Uncharacterized protein n=1 Tax=Dothidotthia symphoricarpi CBS 119687 TaxID=1392245 RepID=A0A6A6AEQ8_9PLEO|nr:uncharacterized protein P153DRAFT_340405 [Dothidotthia symphoricarpi CBS 119687]KAF2129498.1 hypothetical protein P153DRAFT_340405 [Dothidotthia symphoricarpi CBS 119687]